MCSVRTESDSYPFARALLDLYIKTLLTRSRTWSTIDREGADDGPRRAESTHVPKSISGKFLFSYARKVLRFLEINLYHNCGWQLTVLLVYGLPVLEY